MEDWVFLAQGLANMKRCFGSTRYLKTLGPLKVEFGGVESSYLDENSNDSLLLQVYDAD